MNETERSVFIFRSDHEWDTSLLPVYICTRREMCVFITAFLTSNWPHEAALVNLCDCKAGSAPVCLASTLPDSSSTQPPGGTCNSGSNMSKLCGMVGGKKSLMHMCAPLCYAQGACKTIHIYLTFCHTKTQSLMHFVFMWLTKRINAWFMSGEKIMGLTFLL